MPVPHKIASQFYEMQLCRLAIKNLDTNNGKTIVAKLRYTKSC